MFNTIWVHIFHVLCLGTIIFSDSLRIFSVALTLGIVPAVVVITSQMNERPESLAVTGP